jgi:O-antigen/teichoic acid export membrane protein
MMVRLLFAADRERDLLPIGALGIVANVILNALLIPRMGIEGAAVATLVSYGLTLALYFFYARRAGFRVPVWASAGGALLALAAAIAVTVLLKERALWVRASASALTWLVVLTVLRVNGLRELQEALRLLRKR